MVGSAARHGSELIFETVVAPHEAGAGRVGRPILLMQKTVRFDPIDKIVIVFSIVDECTAYCGTLPHNR
jgi:hypothetical protein